MELYKLHLRYTLGSLPILKNRCRPETKFPWPRVCSNQIGHGKSEVLNLSTFEMFEDGCLLQSLISSKVLWSWRLDKSRQGLSITRNVTKVCCLMGSVSAAAKDSHPARVATKPKRGEGPRIRETKNGMALDGHMGSAHKDAFF